MGYLDLGITEQQGQPGGNVAISEGQGLGYQVHLLFYKGALLGGISLPLSDGKLLSSQALEEATLNALLGCQHLLTEEQFLRGPWKEGPDHFTAGLGMLHHSVQGRVTMWLLSKNREYP